MDWTHMRDFPAISVVMPVRDEERHLAEAAARVLEQDYPGEMELVLALAPSRDGTAEIAAALAECDARVRLVENPTGRTPSGLNLAIAAAKHDIIARVDGHGLLSPGYLRRAVETLQRTGAANVGGIMQPDGHSDFERAVARAMSSRFGIGGGRFHLGGSAGAADSVYLGVFRRDVLQRLGGYDEHFTRAQDWELNYRIRAAGETVWFSPNLVVTYWPRSTLGAFARQFYGSGQWRRELLRRHPGSASLRYLAAPVATAAIGAGTVAGLVAALGGPNWLVVGWLVPSAYAGGVVAAGLAEGAGLPLRTRLWLPAVLAVMHLSWGAGFLRGVRRWPVTEPRRQLAEPAH